MKAELVFANRGRYDNLSITKQAGVVIMLWYFGQVETPVVLRFFMVFLSRQMLG
jgi:hypothetical protein